MEKVVEIRRELERGRTATEELLRPVSDDELVAQLSPQTPPLVWMLAHVARFEELWILRTIGEEPPIPDVHDHVYGAFRRERQNGAKLPTLKPSAVRAYATDVRERSLEMLERIDLDAPDVLVRRGFVFGLVLQNELQTQESMLEGLQSRLDREYPVVDSTAPDRAPSGPDEILVPGGTFTLGAEYEPWAYDNELEAHETELPAFRIDRALVTNGQFAAFVDDRGYRTQKLWSDAGWEWRQREDASAPLYWERSGYGWERVRFGRREPITPWEPVQHVSFHEAEAFARWAGKRLPTEIEWERAAGWNDREGKFRYPWGQTWMGFEASLDRRRWSPAPSGSYAGGVSPVGCVQMAGDVWEWTSSAFRPYPGFEPFPYPECSEVNFGDDVRVLRGGSWATDAIVARTSFRRWESPERREAFAGFRLARDA
ncbi:MAG TPA: ergothioneine biosynthesis protein EgtB [Gaiellaceae bacterium]|nr:ergothioneine biosynthesis protein EgtB [Gaiellaceae bacterium]